MDTILNKLLARARAFLRRAVAYVKSPEPSGFEYLASVVLQARLETLQRELSEQGALLAQVTEQRDGAVAEAAAIARETIGLHLQIDELRQQIPDCDILRRTNEALAGSDARVAELTTALAESERRVATAEREKNRLQIALTRAEAANQAATDVAARAPVRVEEMSSPAPLSLASPPLPARDAKATRRGPARKDADKAGQQRREAATH
jgi:small-conductance mechanosensitive channel